ncbi:MAG: VWA domain-containing protein [Acidobacteriaceae bacterium]|nr:VWA domain-containing protein [Acidobacteriaceae bacterium]
MKSFVVALLCSALAIPMYGQTGDVPTALQVYSKLVSLDVVVTDKNGSIVTDLRKEDFEVLENKQTQVIKNFETIQSHKLPGDAGKIVVRSSTDLASIGTAPVTILVLDEMIPKFSDVAYSRQCIEQYLKLQSDVLAQPTMLLVVRSDKFMVLRDYTQDRKSLLDAIQSYKPVNPQVSGMGAGSGRRIIMTLGALEQIAKSQLGVPGRKNIIWIGKGFPAVDPTGDGISEQALESFKDSLQMATDVMLRARVALSVIAPEGLVGGGMVPTSILSGDDTDPTALAGVTTSGDAPDQGVLSFGSLAALTGGRFIYNRNDIDQQIESSLREGASYYTLSYVPHSSDGNDADYRHIRVLLKRPGLYVQTRQGYYAPNAVASAKPAPTETQITEAEQKTQVADLANAATNRMRYSAIHIESTEKAEAGGYRVYVRAADLSWTFQDNGTFTDDASLFAVSFSAQGKATGQSYVFIRKTLVKPPLATENAEVVYDLPFLVSSKAARVRFVIRDERTGKLGTADQLVR